MKNILIIEDERTVAELERDYLEINSLKVSIEETGEGGLKRILKNDIDLIILDLMLPDMMDLKSAERYVEEQIYLFLLCLRRKVILIR